MSPTVWNSALALWSDDAAKSPNKPLPHFQLAYAHYEKGQCLKATHAYARAAEFQPPDDHLYVDDRIHIAAPGVGEVFPTLNAKWTEPIVLCVSTLYPHKGIKAKAGPNVEIAGWLDREDIYDLYPRASLFVFPSTFEGFGMPILEASAAGLPTICADARPMRDWIAAEFTRQKTAQGVLQAAAAAQKPLSPRS